ncbi:MAG: hypothetical protein ACO3E8_05195 [Candidatus Methylacidiphilales bacterium]
MADPRSLFGERRLPERLGGRQVDRYIPPEIRQGIGGFLAGIEMLNPVTAYRDYMLAARRGDYPEAAVNLAGFVAPGVASGLASRAIRPVVRAARGAVSSADEGARALMEMLSPVGAVDDLAARGYGEGLPPEVEALLESRGFGEPLDEEFEALLNDPRFFEPEPEPLLPAPPAAIDIFEQVPFTDRASDLDRLRDLRRLPEALTEEATLDLIDLRIRQDLGEFDDLLTGTDLLENFRELRSMDADGLLTAQALVGDGLTPNEADIIINRYRGLEQRFGQPEEGLLDITDLDLDEDFVPAQVPPTLVPVPTTASSSAMTPPISAGETLLYSRAANAAKQLRQPVYTDPAQVRRELEARGAPGRELDLISDRLDGLFLRSNTGRVEASTIREWLDAAPRLEFNRSGEFASYSVPGGTNYRATFVTHPSVRDGPEAAFDHFGRRNSPPLFHTRAADYTITTPEGSPARTHHVIEIQSDWAQYRQGLSATKLEPLSDAESLEWRRLGNEYQDLGEQQRRLENRMQGLDYDSPELQRVLAEHADLQTRIDQINPTLEEYSNRIYSRDRQTFDKKYPAPFVKDENDWVDAGVRQNLLDAVTKDSEYITFGNGRQANQHINMPREAAERFYDRQVPRSVERVLKKFAREAGVEVPEIQRLPFVDGDEVIGFRLTPEFREAVRRVGLPSFRRGGLVSLLPV